MKTLRLSILLAVLSLFSTSIVGGAVPPEPIRFMMNPHVHGDLITFSYQGDIWIVDRDGTPVRRVTNHVARDVSPRFSPDGRTIAFSSNRFGNNDVFLVPVEGGSRPSSPSTPRVTMWRAGPGTAASCSSPPGGTIRSFRPSIRCPRRGISPFPWRWTRPGTPPSVRTAGIWCSTGPPVSTSRKGQRGNRTTDIWIMDREAGTFTKLTDPVANPEMEGFREHVHDAIPMWGADDMIYFVSERDGIFNLWKMSPDGGNVSQVTRHTQGGVKYPAISNDGRTIVYTNDHELFVLDVPSGTPQPVSVELSFDPSINQVEWVDVEDQAQGFGAHPDGDMVAVDSRGEIFLVPTDPEKGEKTTDHGFGLERPLPELLSRWIATWPLFRMRGPRNSSGSWSWPPGERRKLTDHDSYKTGDYVWSPDSDRIAFVAANTPLRGGCGVGPHHRAGLQREPGFQPFRILCRRPLAGLLQD